MLPTTLNTNEVKNSAGTEVEFGRLKSEGRTLIYAASGEVYSRPHRLTISHLENGVGLKRRRRSLVRFDKTVMSDVETTTPVTISIYAVADLPIGALATTTEAYHVNAELISFLASLGASTTILYDGTGNGSSALLTGLL